MKKFFRTVGILIFGAGLFLSLTTFITFAPGIFLISQKDTVKTWLNEANTYDNLSPALKALASEALSGRDENSTDQVGVDIDQIIDDAFTPEFWQINIEKILDSTHAWLNKEATKPDFKLEVEEQKEVIIEALAQYQIGEYAKLPPCTDGQVADDDFDPGEADCIPENLATNPELIKEELGKQLDDDLEFLSDGLISSDEMFKFLFGSGQKADNPDETNANAKNQPPTTEEIFENAPKVFSAVKLLPYIILIAGLINGLLLWAIIKKPKPTAKKVLTIMIAAGLTMITIVFTGDLLMDIVFKQSAQSGNDQSELSNIIIPLRDVISTNINNLTYIIAGVIAGVGLIGRLGFWVYEKRRQKTAKK